MKIVCYKNKVYHKVLETEDLMDFESVYIPELPFPDLKKIFKVGSDFLAKELAADFYNDFFKALIDKCVVDRNIVEVFGTKEYSKGLANWNMWVDNRSTLVRDFNFYMGGYNPCLVLNMRMSDIIAARASHKFYHIKVNINIMKKIRENVKKNKLYHSIIVNDDV